MLGGAVGAPYVAGVGCLGSACCDLMLLGGIGTNILALLRKQLRIAGERSDAIESVARGGHSGCGNSYALLGAMGA